MMDEDCMFLNTGATSLVRAVQGSELLGCSLKRKYATILYMIACNHLCFIRSIEGAG